MALWQRFQGEELLSPRLWLNTVALYLGLALGALGVAALPGCSSDDPAHAPAAAGSAGSGGGATCALAAPLPDGTCITAGVPPEMCGEGFTPDGKQGCEPILPNEECPDDTMPMLGMTTCHPVGVPADSCDAGFVADGHAGCEPILPATECPAGQLAVPGDTSCRAPQSCGVGTWGDIPIGPGTKFVDGSYAGGDSDGTMGKPWKTIAQGVSSAGTNAIVAVAAGSYPEDLTIDKGVKLWGVCPSKVALTGTGSQLGALMINELPSGHTVELHGLGITGLKDGVDVLGATGVTLAGLWIHDTGGTYNGLYLQDEASVSVVDTLFEATHAGAVLVFGSSLVVQRSVIRGTLPRSSDHAMGRGIEVDVDEGKRGRLTLSSSLLDQNHDVGLIVFGSDATVSGTVIRNTQPDASNKTSGRGISVRFDEGERGVLSLSSSLLDQNHDLGMFVSGSDVTVESTVIRNTQPNASDMTAGRGIGVQNDGGGRGALSLSSSLLDQNHDTGLIVLGSDVTIQGTVLRNTQPQSSDMTGGRGISVQANGGGRGTLSLSSSLLDQNHDAGIFASGSDVTVVGTVVRNTQPQASDHTLGRGIDVQFHEGERGALSLSSSLLDQNHDVGLIVFGSDAIVTGTVIRNTQPDASDGANGLGIGVQLYEGQRGGVSLSSSLLDQSHNHGIFVSGSDATVSGTVIRNTQPNASDMTAGRGIGVQNRDEERGALTLSSSLLDQNHEIGLFLSGSDATVQSTIIQNTQPQTSDQTFGDGMSLTLGHVTVESCMIGESARASISNFGADVEVRDVVVRCSPILFDIEVQSTDPYTGQAIPAVKGSYTPANTSCSACDGAALSCKAVSEHLTAPSPIPPLGTPTSNP